MSSNPTSPTALPWGRLFPPAFGVWAARVPLLLALTTLFLYAPLSFDPGSTEPFGIFKLLVTYVAVLGAAASYLGAAFFLPKSLHPVSRPLTFGGVLLLAVLLLSVLNAVNKFEALEEVNRILMMLVLFWSMAHVRWSPVWVRRLLLLGALPALWISFIVMMEYTGHLDVFGVQVVLYRKEFRVLAFFGHNNIIAQYLLVCACWLLGILLREPGRAFRATLAAGLGWILMGLFFTFCRSSWLSLFGSACILLLVLTRRMAGPVLRGGWRWILFALGFALAGILFVKSISPSPDSQGFRASQWKEAGVLHHVSSGRFQMWDASVRMFQDNLWSGVGAGNYWVMYGRYDPARSEFVRTAHNDYLQFLCEYGLPGSLVLLFLGLAWASWVWSRLPGVSASTSAAVLPLLAGILASLADAFFSYDLQQNVPAALFACCAGILVGLLRSGQGGGLGLGARGALACLWLFLAFVEGSWISRSWAADQANSLSSTLQRNGDLAEAAHYSRMAVDLRPGHASYHNTLGVLYHKLGDRKLALRHYQEAVELSPFEQPNYLGILSLIRQDGDFKEMRGWLKAYLDIAPHKAEFRMDYARMLFEKGLFADAVGQYDRLLQDRPGDPLTMLNLGNACLKLKDFRRARLVFEQLSLLPPGRVGTPGGFMDAAVDITHGLAVALDGTGETGQAYARLDAWKRGHPDDVWPSLTELDIALSRGDLPRAREAALRARALDPSVPLDGSALKLLGLSE